MRPRRVPRTEDVHDLPPGMEIPKRPDYEMVKVPEDLTEISDARLMGTFQILTAWSDFSNVQLALAEIEESEAKAKLARVEAEHLIVEKGSTVTKAKADRAVHPDVREAQDVLHQKYARRKLINALHENLERNAGVVSRELSRRIGMRDQNRRVARYQP